MIVAQQHGAPRRIRVWWDIHFWYRCTEHPEFGSGHPSLVFYHFVPGHGMSTPEFEQQRLEAEDKAVGLERQPDGGVFEVAK